MKKLFCLFCLLPFFLISCGDNEKKSNPSGDSSDTGASENGEESGDSDSGSSADSGDSSDMEDSDGDSGDSAAEADKFCVMACEKASDCIYSTATAITDEDNYKCKGWKCEYLGCLSDAECAEVYAATGRTYLCNKDGSYGYPECALACSTSEDCNLYGAGSTQYAYDSDNYSCISGKCVYIGCLNDSECYTTLQSTDYRCIPVDYSGKKLNVCTTFCESDTDCGSAYECRNSQCIMKKCENDEWCRDYIGADYSCL